MRGLRTILLEFQQLSRQFEQGKSICVSGQLINGTILAIRGVSGSGKSTLLKILARLLRPDSGEVFFMGKNWLTFPPQEWRTRVHYVAQKPVLFEGSVADNLCLPFSLKTIQQERSFNIEEANQFLERVLLPLSILSQPAQTLSGGEAARVSLVRALLLEPQVLLLDEPTAYLDSDSSKALMGLLCDWLREDSRGIIIVSHDPDDLEALPLQVHWLDLESELRHS